MKVDAPKCLHPGCSNRTRHLSSRCHHHRSTAMQVQMASRSVPVPTATDEWVSGRGMVHPTGGYDTIKTTGTRGGRRYYRDAMLHREDGPAVVQSPGGRLRAETYWLNGMRHREDGPAERHLSADGRVTGLSYYRNGLLHRLDGPAKITRVVNAVDVIHEQLFLAVDPLIELTGRDFRSRLSVLSDEELRDGYALTPLAPLIDQGHDPRRLVEAVVAGIRTPEGVRALLEGSPVEWVHAFESDHDPFDVPLPEAYPESVRSTFSTAETRR